MLTLPKHPVPMKSTFRNCFLVNYSVDPAAMASVLPAPLEADIFDGRAYLCIVIAELYCMRPAFVPWPLGISYNQVLYRALVHCQGEKGVHFLRSDADSKFMCAIGNLMTNFRFNYARISSTQTKTNGNASRVDFECLPQGESGSKDHANIHSSYDLALAGEQMPASSHFKTLSEARPFIVERHAAFTPDAENHVINIVRIKRGEWNVSVVPSLRADYEYMQGGLFNSDVAELDSVFAVQNVHYHWDRLEKKSWGGSVLPHGHVL